MMGDKLPNYLVEQQRLKCEILAQQAAASKQYLEILEMVDRKERLLNNIEATLKSIKEKQDRLTSLEETHGKLDDAEFLDVVGGV